MNEQERLFAAIGEALPHLIVRSERRQNYWIRYSLAAAACLALMLTAGSVFIWRTETPVVPLAPVEETPGSDTFLPPDGSEIGTLRLLSYAPQSQDEAVDFLIYVNEEQFFIREEKGLYSIRSINSLPEYFPECGLDIFHMPQISASEAKREAKKTLAERYAEFIPGEDDASLYLRASNGTEWNSEQAELWFIDDGQGGAFVLTARYFLEAEEGLGMLFRDMASSFRVISLKEAVPEWMRSLYAAADRLFPALLSNDLSSISDLLAEDAEADAYGENVWANLTVASVDYVLEDDQNPASARVSVKHRLNLEEGESYNYLTMELIRRDDQWLLSWSGIEK